VFGYKNMKIYVQIRKFQISDVQIDWSESEFSELMNYQNSENSVK